jgi:CTP synthase
MRLGSYQAILKKDSLISRLYGAQSCYERHRHRYEVNPAYHQILQDHGLIICGLSPDGRLAEFIELENHPYFVATQSHPELKSRLEKPSPMFDGLVEYLVTHKQKV